MDDMADMTMSVEEIVWEEAELKMLFRPGWTGGRAFSLTAPKNKPAARESTTGQ